MLSASQQTAIVRIVGDDRARFDIRERRAYSHDTSVLPGVLRLLERSTLADGIAQPETEEQVLQLAQFAGSEGIPLVPRGKATSGYGGAVPARGGLVIDLTRLKGIVNVDAQALSVTVAAGTLWQDLEQELETHGLALCLYPTSAPASTVGGWLAQGGAGIGSHAFGWFRENVHAARIVTGTGTLRAVSGDELRTVADAEGTTGIITEVTLGVRRLDQVELLAIAFPDASALSEGLRLTTARNLPVWSISFINPAMACMKNLTSHAQSGSRLREDRYIALFAYEARAAKRVADGLRHIALPIDAERLPASVARHEWSQRFKPMRLKRLGPSLVVAEVVVPLEHLTSVLGNLQASTRAPLAIEGASVCGRDVVLVCFSRHDERRLSYTFAQALTLSAIRVAERHGGRVYSTGRYFGSRAARVLGRERIAALKSAKAHNDPKGILNPGKVVFRSGALGLAVDVASALEPVARRFANAFGQPPAALSPECAGPQRGFPGDVVNHAYACAQCGYCVDVCPQFQVDGWESSGPRGKWCFLESVFEGRDRFDNQMTDVFSACTACGKCDLACQLDLPILASWGKVRGVLWNGMLTRSS